MSHKILPQNVQFCNTGFVDDLAHHWRQAIGILAKRGGRFISIRRVIGTDNRAKGDGLIDDWNLPANTLSKAEALRALGRERNIGLATGSGDLYVLDFDRDADRGHECDQLAGGLYTYRANAPHKAKFIFRCEDRLPSRKQSKQHGIDLLGWTKFNTDEPHHDNAVIAGVHGSGEPIRWGGHSVPTLDRETVAALWHDWTGLDLFREPREHHAPSGEYADVELATVAEALSHIDPWALDYNAWLAVLGALHDTFGDAALDLACEWGDGGVEERWQSFGDYGAGGATLASIFYRAREAGWVDTRRQRFHEQVLYTQAWLETPAAAAAFAAANVRYTTGRKIVDALAEICAEWGSATVRPGLRLLALRAAMGVEALRRNLARLAAANLLTIGDRDPEHPFDAVPITLVLQNDHSIPTDGTTVIVLQNYSDHRCDDAFRNNHAAYKRKLPDGLAPLGETALVALVELLRGDYDAQEIADALGISVHGIRRGLGRALDYGLVTVTRERHNRQRFHLVEEWRTDLDVLRRNMTTNGLQRRRTLAYNEARLESAKRSGDTQRIERATEAYNRSMAHEWPEPNPAQWVDGKRRSARTWIRFDTLEADRAQADLRTEVQRLRLERVPVLEIRRMMAFAGYDPRDVSHALAFAPRQAVAA